jgi:hypothetical protein
METAVSWGVRELELRSSNAMHASQTYPAPTPKDRPTCWYSFQTSAVGGSCSACSFRVKLAEVGPAARRCGSTRMAWTPTRGTASSASLPLSTVSLSCHIPPHSGNGMLWWCDRLTVSLRRDVANRNASVSRRSPAQQHSSQKQQPRVGEWCCHDGGCGSEASVCCARTVEALASCRHGCNPRQHSAPTR